MGQYLSTPVTEKDIEDGSSTLCEWGVCSMQGWRVEQEDAHAAHTGLNNDPDTAFFGVYDGHGGKEVSKFSSRYIADALTSSEEYKKGDIGEAMIYSYLRMDEIMMESGHQKELQELAREGKKKKSKKKKKGLAPQAIKGILESHLLRAQAGEDDQESLQRQLMMSLASSLNGDDDEGGEDGGEDGDEDEDDDDDEPDPLTGARREGPQAGCTAISACIHGGKVYAANAGDSRCVLSRKGRAVAMSHDHKPTAKEEYDRIVRAGGFVTEGRVNGSLNLSRALGDMEYKGNKSLPPKEQIVTAYPDIMVQDLQPGDEFLVIACDGIWDCMTNQQAVDYVRDRIATAEKMSDICSQMCDDCLAQDTQGSGGIGCDNMTCMVVKLTRTCNDDDLPNAHKRQK